MYDALAFAALGLKLLGPTSAATATEMPMAALACTGCHPTRSKLETL